jgi:low temperature requirement protein LtrA
VSGRSIVSPEDQRVTFVVLAVAITCALWWTYFTRAKSEVDHALAAARGSAQSRMARDAFSLIHFPLLCGVIAYAAVVEAVVSHPHAHAPLPPTP